MYNAWNLIIPGAVIPGKKKISRAHSTTTLGVKNLPTSIAGARGNTLQRGASLNASSGIQQHSPPQVQSHQLLQLHQSQPSQQSAQSSHLQSSSQLVTQRTQSSFTTKAASEATTPPPINTGLALTLDPRISVDGSPTQILDASNSPKQQDVKPSENNVSMQSSVNLAGVSSSSAPSHPHAHVPVSNALSQSITTPNSLEESHPPSGAASSNETDIDTQLYHTLNTVINMVNVVYAQLTSAITKSAIASTKDAEQVNSQPITSTIASKIKDLTDTCFQSMELSKILKKRLALVSSSELDIYLTTSEKMKTWEDINAFLKSIISILANTKVIMKDLPILNEVRPNLASLAKVTKDVTVILDLSSYRTVSMSTPALQNQPPVENNIPNSSAPSAEQTNDNSDHHGTNSYMATPLSTPSLVTNHTLNPFDQL